MRIVRMREKDIRETIKIHLENISDVSSVLGEVYAGKLYRILFARKECHIWGLGSADNPAGLAVVSGNPSETVKAMHAILSPSTYFRLIIMILTGKITLPRLFNRVMFERYADSIREKDGSGVVVFCVSEKFRRKGFGRILMQHIIKIIHKLRVQKLYVDTQAENLPALEFYKACGFKKIFDRFGTVLLEYNID